MKTNIEPRRAGEQTGGHQLRNGETSGEPVINWPALWARLAMGGRRIWVACRYLLGKQPYLNRGETSGLHFDAATWRKRWQWMQVGIIAAGIYYVTHRDVNFSIHLKAPVGREDSGASRDGNEPAVERMSLAQAVRFTPASGRSQTPDASAQQYIARFSRVAMAEYHKFGIPPAIKMAQALLESQAGQSQAALAANNHFGGIMGQDQYESAWANWRAHSLLLRDEYSQLFSLGEDLRSWAKGLERMGYSRDERYAERLLQLIDQYHLDEISDTEL